MNRSIFDSLDILGWFGWWVQRWAWLHSLSLYITEPHSLCHSFTYSLWWVDTQHSSLPFLSRVINMPVLAIKFSSSITLNHARSYLSASIHRHCSYPAHELMTMMTTKRDYIYIHDFENWYSQWLCPVILNSCFKNFILFSASTLNKSEQIRIFYGFIKKRINFFVPSLIFFRLISMTKVMQQIAMQTQ